MTRLLTQHTAICLIFNKFRGDGALTFSAAETGAGKMPVI